jgi:hypothetical protein
MGILSVAPNPSGAALPAAAAMALIPGVAASQVTLASHLYIDGVT